MFHVYKSCSRPSRHFVFVHSSRIPLYSSAAHLIINRWTIIHILRVESTDFHTNLYVERCLCANKLCSRSKSLLCRHFFVLAQGSGRQASPHIEIYMEINELKPGKYAHTKN